ncbi:hypothetical protein FGO68_gene16334 [Halteria grandinella]|uniref:Cyclic nucleotide-binding domain-containing protein n=1 Tax=Halteria grandinella TaxID=5974 RepID=A0A8J8NEY3_HALGN|nr:hypothetical protein FGO68_gene16334 [Halteria grandinella]
MIRRWISSMLLKERSEWSLRSRGCLTSVQTKMRRLQNLHKMKWRQEKMLSRYRNFFQTEVQVENAIRQAESLDIRELGESYLKDPKGTEESLFYVNSTAKQHQVISDHSIDKLRPDYQKFYTKVFDYIRSKIHNYPNVKYPRKIKRFDDKLIRIETVDPKSFLIRLPYQKMVKIMNSFWRDYNAFAEFLYTYVPLLTNYTLKQKQKIMSCFHEEQFSPLQPIMRERTIPDHIYIVVSGQVRLVTSFNPFTQKYNKANKCEESTDQILLKNANGLGNISKTVSENNIGLMQSGQWLGEEIALMKVPLIYSAIATTDVKLLKVSVEDFQAKFPSEIHSILENKCYEKLDWIRSRLEKCHLLRKEISAMNQISKTYEKTISHVRGIYPTSTLPAQLNIRKALMNESSNNPNLLLFTQNKRIEKLRVLEEERTGKQTFKSYIVEQERERALKEKLSESLKQMVSAQMSRSKVQGNREGGLSVMQNYNIAVRKPGGGGTQSVLSQYGLDNPLQVRGENTMRINLSLLRGNISNSVIDTDRKRLGLNVKLPQSVAGDNLLEAAETSVDTKSILSQQFQVRTNLSMPQSYRNGDVIPEMPTGSEDTMGDAAAYLSSKMDGSDQQSQEIIKVTEQSSSLPMLVQNHHAQQPYPSRQSALVHFQSNGSSALGIYNNDNSPHIPHFEKRSNSVLMRHGTNSSLAYQLVQNKQKYQGVLDARLLNHIFNQKSKEKRRLNHAYTLAPHLRQERSTSRNLEELHVKTTPLQGLIVKKVTGRVSSPRFNQL